MKLRNWIRCIFGLHARKVVTLHESRFGEPCLCSIIYCPHCYKLLCVCPEVGESEEDVR